MWERSNLASLLRLDAPIGRSILLVCHFLRPMPGRLRFKSINLKSFRLRRLDELRNAGRRECTTMENVLCSS